MNDTYDDLYRDVLVQVSDAVLDLLRDEAWFRGMAHAQRADLLHDAAAAAAGVVLARRDGNSE